MSYPTTSLAASERLDVLFAELAELTGQRNAIDGRIVAIVAEVDRDGLWAATGARSVAALVAWKTGVSPVAGADHRRGRSPGRGVPALTEGCGRAGCRWIRSG